MAKYYSESWLKAQQYIVAVKKIKNFKFYPHFLPPPWPIGERTYETGPKRNLKTEYTRARYFCYAAEHVQSTRHEIPIYDMERTICDLVRNRKQFEIQDYQTALKTYVSRKDKDLNRLMKYAKLFHVDSKIREYMEVIL